MSVPLIAAIAAAAITQNVYAAASVFVIGIVYGIILLVSFIPIVGVFLQYYLMGAIASPWLLATFAVPANAFWIVSGLFWLDIILGAIVTIIVTIIVILALFNQL